MTSNVSFDSIFEGFEPRKFFGTLFLNTLIANSKNLVSIDNIKHVLLGFYYTLKHCFILFTPLFCGCAISFTTNSVFEGFKPFFGIP